MNERKGRVLEALLETVEFAVLSYAMSGAAFALRRDPLWILFMVVEIRLLQKYWAALGCSAPWRCRRCPACWGEGAQPPPKEYESA